MRVAVYARVSTDRQHGKNLSIPGQIAAIEAFAAQHDMMIVTRYVETDGESAQTTDRPEFQKMLAHALSKNRQWDALLVWAFDRFTRYTDGEIALLQMKMRGVRVYSVTESVAVGDDDSGMSEILESLSLKLAQVENRKKSAAVRRGMTTAAQRGAHAGRVPYGYRRVFLEIAGNRQPRLELHPDEAPVVQMMFNHALSGLGTRAIAERLNADGYRRRDGRLWTNEDAQRMLKCETYLGRIAWGKKRRVYGTKQKFISNEIVRVENTHTAIVSHETFNRVRELMASRTFAQAHPRTVASTFLLSSLVTCRCGAPMRVRTASNAPTGAQYRYYQCSNAGLGKCTQKMLKRDDLEMYILNALADQLLQPETIRAIVALINDSIEASPAPAEAAAVEAQIATARRKLANIMTAIEDGTIEHTDAKPRVLELKQQIASLEPRLYELSAAVAETPAPLRAEDVERYIENFFGVMIGADKDQQKSLVRSFIRSVQITSDSIIVEYRPPIPPQQPDTDTDAGAIAPFGVLQGSGLQTPNTIPNPEPKAQSSTATRRRSQLISTARKRGFLPPRDRSRQRRFESAAPLRAITARRPSSTSRPPRRTPGNRRPYAERRYCRQRLSVRQSRRAKRRRG